MKKSITVLSLFAGCQLLFSATFNIANGDVAGLISAITTANTNGQTDIINLAANGMYTLTAVNYTSANPGQDGSEAQRGFPNIANNVNGLDLTINGNGATIQRNTSAPEFGFFACTGQTVFNNIIFRNARVNAQGAAIFVAFKGNIEVNNCSFYDNTSLFDAGERGGGAIYTKSLSALTVKNSYFENNISVREGGAISVVLSNITLLNNTFKSNRTTRPAGSAGGAVFLDGARGDNGSVIIRDNLFENNSANNYNTATGGLGGALFLFPYRNQSVEVTGCTFKTNSAKDGGAFWHKGGAMNQQQANGATDPFNEYTFTAGAENTTLILNNCIFDGNTSSYVGGGLWLADCIINEIYNCTFKNNFSPGGGGIALSTNRPLTIRNCTFNNNTANIAGAINAGINAKLTIQNCTFTANIANQYGGAISVPQNDPVRPVDIINCTFAGNQANNQGNGQSGAIHSGDSSLPNPTVMIKNNLFYNQSVTNPWNVWKHCNSVLNDGGNNLFFPENANGRCVATPGNSLFLDPLLSSLASNGGLTQTMALQTGSPAIDAGSGCTPTDQRGVARVGACDIGAYEYTGTLSVENLVKNNNELQVYPNPSTGNFFIKMPSELGTEKAKVQVFALDGKLVFEKEINKGNDNSVNLTSKGMYIIKTTIGTQVFTNKIVIY